MGWGAPWGWGGFYGAGGTVGRVGVMGWGHLGGVCGANRHRGHRGEGVGPPWLWGAPWGGCALAKCRIPLVLGYPVGWVHPGRMWDPLG